MSPGLGCYGDAFARTPRLDRLASEGTRYSRAFATAPVCSPARSCLITGIHASTLGTGNLRSRFPIPPRFRGFPALLRAAGYFTANNVKTDYNTSDEGAIIAASWDESSPRAHWRNRRPGQPFFCVFNGMVTHQSRMFESFEPELEKLLPAADRHDPAKVAVPPFYPVTPTSRRTIARHYDRMTVLDRDHVGKILDELDRDGLAGDTIVFFFSDHGSGLPRHKRVLHDSGLRVPFIVRFPEKYRSWAPSVPGGVSDRLVTFSDFGPTVLGLAGIAVPEEMEGRPFLGPSTAQPAERVFGSRDRVDEAFDLSRSVRDARYLYIRNYMPHLSWNQPEGYSDQAALRREISRLAAGGRLDAAALSYAAPRRPIEELYDVEADPCQVRNLAGSEGHREALERMRAFLRERIVASRDLGFLPEPELRRRSEGTTPYEMARRPGAYPVERILAAAELSGRPGEAGRMTELLGDGDPAVRYWAALGLHSIGEAAGPAREALRKALADDAPAVRIEAASALAAQGDGDAPPGPEPLAVLGRDLRSDDPDLVLRSARALQLLGPRAAPALPAMEEAFAAVRGKESDPHLSIGFALKPAVEALRVAAPSAR